MCGWKAEPHRKSYVRTKKQKQKKKNPHVCVYKAWAWWDFAARPLLLLLPFSAQLRCFTSWLISETHLAQSSLKAPPASTWEAKMLFERVFRNLIRTKTRLNICSGSRTRCKCAYNICAVHIFQAKIMHTINRLCTHHVARTVFRYSNPSGNVRKYQIFQKHRFNL